MNYRPHVISWNLTQRCNLLCTHCYMSALPGLNAADELGTEECRRVMDEIAIVNPNIFLVLSGGGPPPPNDPFDPSAPPPL